MTTTQNQATSGYCDCACRDCFNIAIRSSGLVGELCHACKQADCDETGQSECDCADAYGCDDVDAVM